MGGDRGGRVEVPEAVAAGRGGEGGLPPLRVGLLGTARINRRILDALADSPVARVVAVASRDGERARAYAAEHGIPGAHGSYEALLADEGLDSVYIGLPNSLHLPWVERSLAAGKHVLCEKPLGLDPDAVAARFDLAAARRLALLEGFAYRHHPQ